MMAPEIVLQPHERPQAAIMYVTILYGYSRRSTYRIYTAIARQQATRTTAMIAMTNNEPRPTPARRAIYLSNCAKYSGHELAYMVAAQLTTRRKFHFESIRSTTNNIIVCITMGIFKIFHWGGGNFVLPASRRHNVAPRGRMLRQVAVYVVRYLLVVQLSNSHMSGGGGRRPFGQTMGPASTPTLPVAGSTSRILTYVSLAPL